jgi:hypothetical protein
LLVTAIFAVSALAMAGLLTYYAKVVGTVEVRQSVRLVDPQTKQELVCSDTNGNGCTLNVNVLGSIVAGDTTYFGPYEIRNYASVEAPIDFEVKVKEGDQEAEGVNARIVGANEEGCYENAQVPSSVPQKSNDEPGKVYFCVEVTSKLNALAGNYTVTVTVKPRQTSG